MSICFPSQGQKDTWQFYPDPILAGTFLEKEIAIQYKKVTAGTSGSTLHFELNTQIMVTGGIWVLWI